MDVTATSGDPDCIPSDVLTFDGYSGVSFHAAYCYWGFRTDDYGWMASIKYYWADPGRWEIRIQNTAHEEGFFDSDATGLSCDATGLIGSAVVPSNPADSLCTGESVTVTL